MRKNGFTLIEVLVVLIIMAILVGTAVTSLSAGLKSAHMSDATRAVQQYVRHAKAVALLKQRPVVITFEEITENGEFVKSRISMDYSGDAVQEQGATPLGQGFATGGGGATTLSGRPVDEQADMAEAAPPPTSPEDDPLAAPPREFEGIHVRGALQENREEARARISVFSNVDVLLRKSSAEREKAAKAEREKAGEPAEGAGAEKSGEEKDEEQTFSAVYEANGRCDPYVVRVWKDGEDEKDALEISVGRFGRVVTGD